MKAQYDFKLSNAKTQQEEIVLHLATLEARLAHADEMILRIIEQNLDFCKKKQDDFDG